MEEIKKVISGIPVFSGLADDQLEELRRIAVGKSFQKNETIFSEGNDGTGFYIVIDGQIKIYKVSAEGKEHILHIYGPGQTFGEVPVFAGQKFPANAVAIARTRTLFFPRNAFVELIARNPSLMMKMLADLSVKLRQFAAQIENLSLKEIPARLATYLIYLSEEQGNNDVVTLDISKGQLASLLGTIPETLSRIFAKLSSQEYLRVDGRTIHLLDRAGLEYLAESGKNDF